MDKQKIGPTVIVVPKDTVKKALAAYLNSDVFSSDVTMTVVDVKERTELPYRDGSRSADYGTQVRQEPVFEIELLEGSAP